MLDFEPPSPHILRPDTRSFHYLNKESQVELRHKPLLKQKGEKSAVLFPNLSYV